MSGIAAPMEDASNTAIRPEVAVLMAEQRGDRDQVLPLTKNVLQLFNYIEETGKEKIS